VILGEPWPYWAVFVITALAWAAVPLVSWWERRAERRDREVWERVAGRRP
jgi:hypothetical protein